MKDRRLGWACGLLVIGAVLRLADLGSSEFKGDEMQALVQGLDLLRGGPWPAHGMPSSQGVANAPLLTWIAALFWALTRDPLGITACVAAVNATVLIPLYLWARRRFSGEKALWVLAFTALSPFAVIYSRKIWGQCLLFPGLVLLLWSVEWMRSRATFWRGAAALAWAALGIGQLHQTGLIFLAAVALAFAVHGLVDRRRRLLVRPERPGGWEIAGLAAAGAVNLFFWWPYLRYVLSLPRGALTSGQRLPWAFGTLFPSGWDQLADPGASHLLRKLLAQLVPVDLFWFFYFDRSAFLGELGPGLWTGLADVLRIGGFWIAAASGSVLGVVGFWGWLKRPGTIPVLGIAWWALVGIVTLAWIPCYPHYVLALAPLPALLLAGAFELPGFETRWTCGLRWLRAGHAASLLALTAGTLVWIGERGGAAGDYGVSYSVRFAQAKAWNGVEKAVPGAGLSAEEVALFRDHPERCGRLPAEVDWLAGWVGRFEEPRQGGAPKILCEAWVLSEGRGTYRWAVLSER